MAWKCWIEKSLRLHDYLALAAWATNKYFVHHHIYQICKWKWKKMHLSSWLLCMQLMNMRWGINLEWMMEMGLRETTQVNWFIVFDILEWMWKLFACLPAIIAELIENAVVHRVARTREEMMLSNVMIVVMMQFWRWGGRRGGNKAKFLSEHWSFYHRWVCLRGTRHCLGGTATPVASIIDKVQLAIAIVVSWVESQSRTGFCQGDAVARVKTLQNFINKNIPKKMNALPAKNRW